LRKSKEKEVYRDKDEEVSRIKKLRRKSPDEI